MYQFSRAAITKYLTPGGGGGLKTTYVHSHSSGGPKSESRNHQQSSTPSEQLGKIPFFSLSSFRWVLAFLGFLGL